jgi:proteic killer suppression protein
LAATPPERRYERVWSLTVTGNWRLVFRMDAGNAHDVGLIDYH